MQVCDTDAYNPLILRWKSPERWEQLEIWPPTASQSSLMSVGAGHHTESDRPAEKVLAIDLALKQVSHWSAVLLLSAQNKCSYIIICTQKTKAGFCRTCLSTPFTAQMGLLLSMVRNSWELRIKRFRKLTSERFNNFVAAQYQTCYTEPLPDASPNKVRDRFAIRSGFHIGLSVTTPSHMTFLLKCNLQQRSGRIEGNPGTSVSLANGFPSILLTLYQALYICIVSKID